MSDEKCCVDVSVVEKHIGAIELLLDGLKSEIANAKVDCSNVSKVTEQPIILVADSFGQKKNDVHMDLLKKSKEPKEKTDLEKRPYVRSEGTLKNAIRMVMEGSKDGVNVRYICDTIAQDPAAFLRAKPSVPQAVRATLRHMVDDGNVKMFKDDGGNVTYELSESL